MQTNQPGIHGNFSDPAASGVRGYVFNWGAALTMGIATTVGALKVGFAWGDALGYKKGINDATAAAQAVIDSRDELLLKSVVLGETAVAQAKIL